MAARETAVMNKHLRKLLHKHGVGDGPLPNTLGTLLTTRFKAFVLPIERIRFSFDYTIHNIFASMHILPC